MGAVGVWQHPQGLSGGKHARGPQMKSWNAYLPQSYPKIAKFSNTVTVFSAQFGKQVLHGDRTKHFPMGVKFGYVALKTSFVFWKCLVLSSLEDTSACRSCFITVISSGIVQ